MSSPETDSNRPDSAEQELTKLGWVAGYPPWYGGALVEQAGCKTKSDGDRLLYLLRSIQDGKPEETRRLLAQGIDPNTRFSEAIGTLLDWAVEQTKHPDCIRALLQAGANPNSSRALYVAASRRSDILGDLLQAGADHTLQSSDGNSLLTEAAFAGNLNSVRLLAKAGADINSASVFEIKPRKKIKNCTPLMIAAYGGNLPMVKFLIESGADIHRTDSAGNNAIVWARAICAKAKAKKAVEVLEKAGVSAPASANLGLPQPPDFSARAKSSEFKKALSLARKITGSAPNAVELAEGPLPGAKAFPVKKEQARTLLDKINPQLQELNSIAFISEDFNASCVVLLPTLDFYEAIAAFETPVGQSISSDDLIRWLKNLQKQQPFEITHIAPDLLRADFITPIHNPFGLAKDIEKICGDVINEPIEKVGAHIAHSRELYLWWD